MAGLTMVRSWHTRDFLFVILAFLFAAVSHGHSTYSMYGQEPNLKKPWYDPYATNQLNSQNLYDTAHYRHQRNLDNLQPVPMPYKFSSMHKSGILPNAMHRSQLQHTWNNNLDLGNPVPYRQAINLERPWYDPYATNPLNSRDPYDSAHYRHQRNYDNLETVPIPSTFLSAHESGILPNTMYRSPLKKTRTDNLDLGNLVQYRQAVSGAIGTILALRRVAKTLCTLGRALEGRSSLDILGRMLGGANPSGGMLGGANPLGGLFGGGNPSGNMQGDAERSGFAYYEQPPDGFAYYEQPPDGR